MIDCRIVRPAVPGGVLAAALAVALVALPSATFAQDYYGDVRPILVENCVSCHSEAGMAWSMEDPEAAYQRRQRIVRAVDRGVMPPWLAEDGHQKYMDDRSLDDASVALIRRWAEEGFQKGEARPDPAPPAPHGTGFQSDLTLDVLPADGYLPNQEASDDYRCFLVEWTGDEPTFVTGFRADPGNRNVAHHVVVFAVGPEMWDRYLEVEDVEEGPGYTCFGGTVPDRLAEGETRTEYESRYPDGIQELDQASHWLAHWAPGMDGHIFPQGTGIPVQPGSGLVVQMHYYASTAPGEKDLGSRVDFMTAESVERPALHLAETRGDWLDARDNETMVIPAGTQRSYQVRENLGDLLGYIADVTELPEERIEAVEIHSANLHMHSFGHSGTVELVHPSGRTETLLSIPRWDLGWQRDFVFTEPKVLSRDALEDSWLGVRCTFENPTEETVYGGYGSMEEMCFNFSYIAVQAAEEPVTASPPSR